MLLSLWFTWNRIATFPPGPPGYLLAVSVLELSSPGSLVGRAWEVHISLCSDQDRTVSSELAVFDDGGKTPAESCPLNSEGYYPAPHPLLQLSPPLCPTEDLSLTELGMATFHPWGPGVPEVTAKADFQWRGSQGKSRQAGLGLRTKPGNGNSTTPWLTIQGRCLETGLWARMGKRRIGWKKTSWEGWEEGRGFGDGRGRVHQSYCWSLQIRKVKDGEGQWAGSGCRGFRDSGVLVKA